TSTPERTRVAVTTKLSTPGSKRAGAHYWFPVALRDAVIARVPFGMRRLGRALRYRPHSPEQCSPTKGKIRLVVRSGVGDSQSKSDCDAISQGRATCAPSAREGYPLTRPPTKRRLSFGSLIEPKNVRFDPMTDQKLNQINTEAQCQEEMTSAMNCRRLIRSPRRHVRAESVET